MGLKFTIFVAKILVMKTLIMLSERFKFRVNLFAQAFAAHEIEK